MSGQVKLEENIINTGHHTDGWLVSGSMFIEHRFREITMKHGTDDRRLG